MTTRLHEYDRLEWWDICRKLTGITEEEFNVLWDNFQLEKAKRKLT